MTAAFGNSYGYDANGNQTTRTIGGVSYTFAYDYENRLTSISGSGVSASFLYDGDGQRVKGTVNGVTTVYIAGVYEWQNGATTLYYEGNALRRSGYASDNGVFYLLQDHLKSSSAFVTQNGTVASRNYYFPFGGNRGGTAFSELTTKRFTGQYHETSLPGGEGLSYYGARWYDAQLGRFLTPDSIVPGPANPQAFNRYAYVLNSPTGLVDPTGHCPAIPSDWGPGICFALFIAPEAMQAGSFTVHGDDRSFGYGSDPAKSRLYVWVSTQSDRQSIVANPSGYIVPDHSKAVVVPTADMPAVIPVGKKIEWHEPSPDNKVTVTRSQGGQISIDYDVSISGPLREGTIIPGVPLGPIAPRLNGSIRFDLNEVGGYRTSVDRDGFPWAEAYYRNGRGRVQTILRSPAVRGNPYDLFSKEPMVQGLQRLSRFIGWFSTFFSEPQRIRGTFGDIGCRAARPC